MIATLDGTMTTPAVHLDGLVHAILKCVTAGPGLGFNRAALLLADDAGSQLTTALAVGPATPEEAALTWSELARQPRALRELLTDAPPLRRQDGFHGLVADIALSLDDCEPPHTLLEAYRTRLVVRVADPSAFQWLPPRLRESFGRSSEMVCVPLVAKDHSIGLIVADNAFSGEPIGEDRVQLVQLLALLAGLALDNAKIYAEVERGAQALQAAFDELRTTQERLIHSERLAAVGAVVARVSHEIRNALATIGGSARRLRANASDPARVAQGTAIIADEVEKLEGLLREMLDFTTPRPPHLAPTDLNQLVKDLAQAHHAELDEHGIALDLALAPALPAVLADAHQLRRVLLNLWRNAREAMDGQAGRERRLTVRTTGATGHPQVEVPDTRPGIPHERRGHLFTPFYTTKPRGSGLGLAIVRKIVDDHGGIIQVGGEPGAGATFVITLQLATR